MRARAKDPLPSLTTWLKSNGVQHNPSLPVTGWRATQALDSTNHPEWLRGDIRHRSFRGIRNIGGPFRAHKVHFDRVPLETHYLWETPFYNQTAPWSEGRFYILPSQAAARYLSMRNSYPDDAQLIAQMLLVSPTAAHSFEMNALGTTAISRVLPTNPVVDLSTTVAELISARKFFSLPGKSGSASGEYLNYQLGIAPVVSDARALREAIKSQDEVLTQYERDSGKLIRRRYKFEQERTFETKVTNNTYPATIGTGLTGRLARPGTLTEYVTTTTDVWFSGAFTYYLPQSGWRKKLSHYDRLYGVKPGAETAWNVIPWSFVADYFANTGDVLKNLDAFAKDGLVMPYGYVMRTTSVNTYAMWKGPLNFGDNWSQVILDAEYTVSTKQRTAATPYGFGLAEGDLNPRQLSILAALGINRK